MKRIRIFAALIFCAVSPRVAAQIVPDGERIVWQGNVGIPGGVPNRTSVFQVIPAGVSEATIQTALNACPSNGVVQLTNGTYNLTVPLVIPSYVTLRGKGAGLTILNGAGTGNGLVRFGSEVQGGYSGLSHNITSGFSKDSTNIVLNNVSGISVGTVLAIDELNDYTIETNNGTYGTINWNSRDSGTRAIGQTVEVTAISGTTVTIRNAMYWTYLTNLIPQALSFTAGCQWGGLENLTLKANNTGFTTMFYMAGSKYCWVKGIEDDYCDGDHGQISWSFRCEVRDSYFHDAYDHDSGSTDSDLMIAYRSSGILVENNIFYRCHTSIMLNWGASGNVIGYNYSAGNFHSPAPDFLIQDMSGGHGPHPMMNLWEGNIGNLFHEDSYWGSSSHNTYLRNWGMADGTIFPPYTGRSAWQTNSSHHAFQALRAFIMDYRQSYGHWVGNVAGCDYAKTHDVRRVIKNETRPYQNESDLFSIDYGDSSDTGSGGAPLTNVAVFSTLIDHGNYDTVTTTNGGIVWQNGITNRTIPDSYYLTGKPDFAGNLPWPFIDPFNPKTAATAITNQPAGYRFVFGAPPTNSVGTPPSFSTQPQAVVRIAAGGTTNFTVGVVGDVVIGLQWKKDGVAISGATSAILTLTSVLTSDSATYTCVATNSVGTNTSTGGVLDVGNPPTFTTQPTDKTNAVGTIYTNLVATTGSATIIHRWYIGPLTNFAPILSATNATLIYSNAPADFYFSIASNSYGMNTSTVARLTLTNTPSAAPPTISQQPDTQTGIAGGIGVVLRVVANGDAPLTYQWYKDGVALDGRTDSLYGITPVTTNAAGTYKVAITNAAGFVISSNAIITINFAPYATTNPTDTRVDLSGTTNLTAAFNGKPVPILQWQLNGTNIVSATNNTLTITTATLLNDGYYQAVASNSVALTTGAVARLSVIVPADPPPHVAFRIVTNAP